MKELFLDLGKGMLVGFLFCLMIFVATKLSNVPKKLMQCHTVVVKSQVDEKVVTK